MRQQESNTNPALLIGTTPSGPRTIYAETPESLLSAKIYQRAERARLELQGVIFADPHGTGSLVAVLRGERA